MSWNASASIWRTLRARVFNSFFFTPSVNGRLKNSSFDTLTSPWKNFSIGYWSSRSISSYMSIYVKVHGAQEAMKSSTDLFSESFGSLYWTQSISSNSSLSIAVVTTVSEGHSIFIFWRKRSNFSRLCFTRSSMLSRQRRKLTSSRLF